MWLQCGSLSPASWPSHVQGGIEHPPHGVGALFPFSPTEASNMNLVCVLFAVRHVYWIMKASFPLAASPRPKWEVGAMSEDRQVPVIQHIQLTYFIPGRGGGGEEISSSWNIVPGSDNAKDWQKTVALRQAEMAFGLSVTISISSPIHVPT